MGYVPTIGLEIHAELKTKSKMFCGCKNEPHDAEPNSHTCPVCMAHPGTLPVPNYEAIKSILLFGRAVNANQASFSEFDRKSYFYPDIPKAYQISQYQFPFLTGGNLSGVTLTRVHLEEDTARNQHSDDGYSLVDFNRAGVPLMELVTEPDIHDADTAVTFARELRLLLRTLGISDANMEKGEMRVEANISVSKTDELGTKVEVKNLNSFKIVEQAIRYEIERQTAVLEEGGRISQETRGWDEVKSRTFSQRSKETAKDYRYFPDPDLPKINTLSEESFSRVRLDEILPDLPNKIRADFTNLGLTSDQVEQMLLDSRLLKVMIEVRDSNLLSDSADYKLAANYLFTDLVALTEQTADLKLDNLNTREYTKLVLMLKNKEINSRIAKNVLSKLFNPSFDVRLYTEQEGLLQVHDEGAIEAIVKTVLSQNPDAVSDLKAGKESALKFLVGQGMKLSKGTADPEQLLTFLKKSL